MKCHLVCAYCKKGFNYSIDEDTCKHCGKKIIDPGIKNLVFAISGCGIKIQRGCEGHNSFDEGNHYPHPWVTIDEEEDRSKLDTIVDGYNYLYVSQHPELSRWITGLNLEAKKYWVFPEKKHRRNELLQKEADIFAAFIFKEGICQGKP